MENVDTYIPASAEGEICRCSQPAVRKVEEVIFDDDPQPLRHPLTAYVCRDCFSRIMGPLASLNLEATAFRLR